MKHILTPLTLAAAFTALPAIADDAAVLDPTIKAQAEALMEAGLKDDVGLEFTESLTTEIGPRLAGSDAEWRARQWAMIKLKDLNFQQAYIEDFNIPYWERVTETASVTGSNPQNLAITALGGSKSTAKDGVEAEVVRFTSLAELKAAPADSLKGKIAFIDERMVRAQDGSGYGYAVGKRSGCAQAAADLGAVACLIRSAGTDSHRMPHTGGMAREGALGALPAAALAAPDADQLARLLERGPVEVKLNIQVKTADSAASGNVIAEVEGASLKEEIVLIGCHLDSWDLGTGAIDDAAGCGIVVAAANLIQQLPGKPKRTIRVVLYGSEEVGLFGGKAYGEAHADQLDKHVLVAESDFGAGRIWRLATGFGEGAMAYAKAMQDLVAPLGVVPGDNSSKGDSDVSVLGNAGVPAISADQDGTDYFDLHHTPDDTFDKIDPEAFRQNVAVYAALTYVAAETGWDFRKAAAPATEDQ
ncbi:M28 family peptidase [Hyphomonas oceanitis]|uniref:Carboxypeptidase Q n=1 Tax=Hyphomonas oceanitis SCH89 TaxID=1280953 RepID=A0A059G4W5_9PROT|nr:M28 family peptidase [Hyphomonas oceanitis]KDA01635.1 peptidase M20:peptidase M28 [Hyphomonas oceanitis SCH89]